MNKSSTTNRSLEIAIAEDHADMQAFMVSALSLLGHRVIGTASTGSKLIEICELDSPDLVFADIAMPELDGIEATTRIFQKSPLPIVLVSAHYDANLLQRAKIAHVMVHLVKPITEQSLSDAIDLARQRFAQFELLRTEALSLRQAISDRWTVERAKTIMANAANLDDAAAFARLQQVAQGTKQRLADVAQGMVAAENVARSAAARTDSKN